MIFIWIIFIIFLSILKKITTSPPRIIPFAEIELHERIIEYDVVEESPDKDDICCICLIELTELDLEIADKIIKTHCNHYYHKMCLMEWINSDNINCFECPLCLTTL